MNKKKVKTSTQERKNYPKNSHKIRFGSFTLEVWVLSLLQAVLNMGYVHIGRYRFSHKKVPNIEIIFLSGKRCFPRLFLKGR